VSTGRDLKLVLVVLVLVLVVLPLDNRIISQPCKSNAGGGSGGKRQRNKHKKRVSTCSSRHTCFPATLVSRPPLFPGHTCFPPHLFPATLVSRHPFSPDFPFHPQLTFGARQQRFVTRRRGRLVGNDGGFSQPVHHVIGVQVKHGSVFPTQHAPQHTRGMDRAFFLSWARKKRVNTQCAKTQK
jgi:hypothetical protein